MVMNKNMEIVSNFLWRFAERCGAQFVSLIVSVVLARLLSPDDYGIIALITVFTTILQVFVDSGLGTALIQKKNADELDFSSVFYFNIVMCIILYGIMFLISPAIAMFYGESKLTPVIRVLSLTIVIAGLKGIQQAYISRNMLFKKFFFATIGGTVISAIIGIGMAYSGYGVWALVVQQLSNSIIDTIILWITVKWRPKFCFSWNRLKGLFSFGWKLLVSALLDTGYNSLSNLIIGKIYSPSQLAYYNQGDKYPNVIVTNINSSIDSVLLPALSNEQDNVDKVKKMTRRAIKTSVFLMAPLMMGIVFAADTIVKVTLTDKWLPCVFFLRIFCIVYMFWPIHTANLNAINALGHSEIFLKLEIVKKTIGVIGIIISMKISVNAMAYNALLVSFICQFINSWPNKRLLNYGYIDQLRDIVPSVLLAVFMGTCILFISKLPLSIYIVLILQIIFGVGIYFIGAKLLKMEEFYFICSILKHFKCKKEK